MRASRPKTCGGVRYRRTYDLASLSYVLRGSSGKQVAAGYVAAQLVANAASLREVIVGMRQVARTAGYVLGEVYVERSVSAPAAFGDLAAHLYGEAQALVVPSLHHLTLIDGGLTVQRYLPLADVPLLVASTPSTVSQYKGAPQQATRHASGSP